MGRGFVLSDHSLDTRVSRDNEKAAHSRALSPTRSAAQAAGLNQFSFRVGDKVLKTRTKIALVRQAYGAMRLARKLFGLGDFCIVTRGGLRYQLDLSQGIDSSIFDFREI